MFFLAQPHKHTEAAAAGFQEGQALILRAEFGTIHGVEFLQAGNI